MGETLKSAKVGLMVIAGLAAALFAYRYIDDAVSGDGGYRVHAHFDDVQGLILKSRVLIAGIPVGVVENIELDQGRAKVTIAVDEGVPLYKNAQVGMRSLSLLGERALVIEPGLAAAGKLEPGGALRIAPDAATTDSVLESAQEIAESVKSVVKQLERSFGTDEAGRRMEDSLKNLSEALEVINRTLQRNEMAINRTVENIDQTTELAGPKIVTVLDNLSQTTGDLREIIANNKSDLNRGVGEADDMIHSIRSASDELEATLGEARRILHRTAEGEGTIGRLTSDDHLIDEVEGIAEGVGDLVGGIARLQTLVELRSEYNFIAKTFKTYFSLKLQPREDRYFLFQLIDDPRGAVSVSQTLVRRSPAARDEPGEYQETRVVREDKLRFSLLVAKRVWFATFRFGIIESSGGVGMDLHFFNDRLEINADMFAIGNQVFPRFRVRAAFEVINKLWVSAGVDDIANERTDFSLGMVLRFNDEDLKSILPFVGGTVPN